MRRKGLFIILVLILALLLSACTSKNNGDIENNPADEETKVDDYLVDEPTDEPTANSGDETEEVAMKMPPFTLKNIDGEEISSDIFGDYDMTIISIWQSTWGPCIGELEALNVIYNEYKEQGVNVLGIAVDDIETFGDEGVRKIIEVLELDFPNVIADYDYMFELINFIRSTPTAIVVDKNGEFLLSPIIGSMGKEGDIEKFRTIIEEYKN